MYCVANFSYLFLRTVLYKIYNSALDRGLERRCSVADPVLKLKDKGPDASVAQDLLNRNGAILDADGDFGSGTESAVREFQTAAGLAVTGVIDAATWQALRTLPEPSADIPTRAVAFIGR